MSAARIAWDSQLVLGDETPGVTAPPSLTKIVRYRFQTGSNQGVASVNRLTVPVGTPISLELTSSGVMNSFFVPQKAMRSERLSNLIATTIPKSALEGG